MDASCQLGLIKQRIAAGGGLRLTVVFDNAGRSAADLSAELTERERAEGRLKTAAAAYRSWLLGRLAAKDALAALWQMTPGETEVL
ncbi:MAG: hypothetical protein LBV79_07100, partial [Candidatus Adiutrix sp.]|nr:hypothetical protein [Candidatus Adiutrix sp.]